MATDYLEVIEDYISRENTDYALMINGKWGTGKTYFFNNTVVPYLIENSKKPIYISLNGIKTIEELSKQLFLETTILTNEKIKKASETKVAKYALQLMKVAHFATVSIGKLDGAELNIDYEELIRVGKNMVLCFDDLERCSLDIVQILGFINSFVEQMEIKTIIICNESEIIDVKIDQNKELKVIAAIQSQKSNVIDKEQLDMKITELFIDIKQYEVIKEKVIGRTLDYEPNSRDIIGQIIQQFNGAYLDFLSRNITIIIDIFCQSEKRNLRTLKHALADFNKIFEKLNTIIPTESEVKDIIIKKYFISALITGIEFRLGTINKQFFNEAETRELTSSSIAFYGNEDLSFNIYNKYQIINTERPIFSKPINNYIVISILDELTLETETNRLINEFEQKRQGRLAKNSYQKLIDDFLEISNEEFSECVIEVLEKIKKAEYPIDIYERVFNQLEYFSKNNIIEISVNELVEMFKEGISSQQEFKPNQDRYWQLTRNGSMSDESKLIHGLVKSHINNLQITNEKKIISEIMDLLPNDVEKFTATYYYHSKEVKPAPIMQYIDPKSYFDKIISLSNENINNIRYLYMRIYDLTNLVDYYKEDYDNMYKLKELLRNHVASTTSITRLNIVLLVNELERILLVLTTEN